MGREVNAEPFDGGGGFESGENQQEQKSLEQ